MHLVMKDKVSAQIDIFEELVSSLDRHCEPLFKLAIDEYVKRQVHRLGTRTDCDPTVVQPEPGRDQEPATNDLSSADEPDSFNTRVTVGTVLCRPGRKGETCIFVRKMHEDGSLSLDRPVRWPSGSKCKQLIPGDLVAEFLTVYQPKGVTN